MKWDFQVYWYTWKSSVPRWPGIFWHCLKATQRPLTYKATYTSLRRCPCRLSRPSDRQLGLAHNRTQAGMYRLGKGEATLPWRSRAHQSWLGKSGIPGAGGQPTRAFLNSGMNDRELRGATLVTSHDSLTSFWSGVSSQTQNPLAGEEAGSPGERRRQHHGRCVW